jgi:hypothetical protein
MHTDEPGHNSWERWRLAGEFRLSAPDWPAGRRRSQEVHVKGERESNFTENFEEPQKAKNNLLPFRGGVDV